MAGEGRFKCGSYEELDQESNNSSSSLAGSSSEERLDCFRTSDDGSSTFFGNNIYPDGVENVMIYGNNTHINLTPHYNLTVLGPACTQILNPVLGQQLQYPPQGGHPPYSAEQSAAAQPHGGSAAVSQPAVYADMQSRALTHSVSQTSSNQSQIEQRDTEPLPANFLKPLYCSQRVLNKQDIEIVSKNLGVGWRDVGTRLLFQPTQLDQFRMDSTSHDNMCYKMLFRWMHWKDSRATIGRLTKCLFLAKEYNAIKVLTP